MISKEYLDLKTKVFDGSRKILDNLMKEHRLDAFGGLTGGPACSIDFIYGDRWGGLSLTSPAAMSGYPHISVPAGFVYDLPVGMSFYAGAYEEGKLLSYAYAFEQANKGRKIPSFKKSFLA